MSLGTIASAHVAAPAGPATKWVNHVAIAAPRNGTTTHTVDPAAGTVAAGTNFTPTAGRLLVLVAEGAVTSTTPSGWTLRDSAVNNTGLYLWTRSAAGGDTISTTHNGSNYPVCFHWFEFNASSTWITQVGNGGIGNSSVHPTLTGITGTGNVVMAAKANSNGASNAMSGTWNGVNVEILDTNVAAAATDGYWLGIAYQENYATTTYAPTCTVANPFAGSSETLSWAIHPA